VQLKKAVVMLVACRIVIEKEDVTNTQIAEAAEKERIMIEEIVAQTAETEEVEANQEGLAAQLVYS
jgi:hypothetical protein